MPTWWWEGSSATVLCCKHCLRRHSEKQMRTFQWFIHRRLPRKFCTSVVALLISMIMYGTNIRDKASYLCKPSLSLLQLLMYSSCMHWHKQQTLNTRHSEQRETPLPLFLGALIHSRTWSKVLVDTLYRLGLSVSYDRILKLSADLGNSAISHSETVGTVCLPTWNIGVFTTSAVDTATSADWSFHGTGISLFKHPNAENHGTKQTPFLCQDLARNSRNNQTVTHLYWQPRSRRTSLLFQRFQDWNNPAAVC